ncbi:TolC family protein [Halanaerocella petrolearia]
MKQKILILLIISMLCTLAMPIYAKSNNKRVLTKKEVINIALEKNSELKKLRKKIKIAEAKLKQAQGAFYPSLDVGGSYTRSGEKNQASFSKNTFSTSLSLNQPIFQGGELWLGYKQAKNSLKLTKLELEQKKQEVTYQVLEEYYAILKAKKMVGVYQQQLEKNKFYLDEAKTNKEVGIHTKTDVLQARVNYTQAQQDLLVAKNNLETAKLNLKNTLELADRIKLKLNNKLTWEEKSLNLEETYKYALNNKVQFKLLNLQQKNNQLSLKQIKLSNKYPNLSLSSSYGTTSDELTFEDGDWKIGLNLSYNLFNGGQDESKIKATAEKVEKAKIKIQETKDDVKLGIKQTLLNIREAKQRIKLSKLNLEQAQDNLKHTEIRFEEGMTTSYKMLDAQATLQQVKTNYYQSIYDYNLAVANLNKMIGKNNFQIDDQVRTKAKIKQKIKKLRKKKNKLAAQEEFRAAADIKDKIEKLKNKLNK